MSETVSLKRARSPSNTTEEPDEKYNAAAQMLMNQAMSNIPVTSARGMQPVGFPLMQYCQMIQQMQHQQIELPMGIVKKDKEESQSTTTTPASSRRQTMSNAAMGPRPIRVPPQSIFNPIPFGMIPHPPQLVPPSGEESQKSPSPSAQSPQPTYNVPSFQRADEEVFTVRSFVESVRQLAAKLTAERS